MGKPAPDRNITQYNGGGIHFSFSSNEGNITFVSLMREIEFLIKMQRYTPRALCSIFENTVTFYEDNQGAIALAVSLQMIPRTKHIAIKYHNF